jgi:hypothetical protein
MTEHYSHVGSQEKMAVAGSIVRMVMGTDTEGERGGSEARTPHDTRHVEANLPN